MSDKFSELMCSGRQEVLKNDTLVDTEQVNSRKGDKFSIVSKIRCLVGRRIILLVSVILEFETY